MNRYLYGLIIFLSALASHIYANDLFHIDGIKAIIYTEGDLYIITESDLARLSLDGTPKKLEDKIFESLAYERAKQRKMLPSEEDIDKHLKAVQRENNLTLDQLKAIFTNAGYTYEEGRNEFAIMSAVNTVLDFEIRSRLLVPEKEIVAYYNAHPEKRPASYYIERAVISIPAGFSGDEKQQFKQELQELVAKNKVPKDTVFSKPFWITKDELAEDKQFITSMKVGSLSMPVDVEGGLEIFRLKEVKPEHNAPLQERYQEIAALLRKPRYEKLMAEYKKSLYDTASIVYF